MAAGRLRCRGLAGFAEKTTEVEQPGDVKEDGNEA
jgi:hypothetical protein